MKEKHHKRIADYTANKSSEPKKVQLPLQRDLTQLEAYTRPWRPRDVFVLRQEQAKRVQKTTVSDILTFKARRGK